ncbi:MAG: DapH/DapD/GlmU-related protein, partial [Bacilli bacterium]|nr:DapH/DapD/GlmU-related protein [Bacilli bacterium]
GDENMVLSSWISDSTIGNHNEIGPYAKLRAGTMIENNCRVGNFVELKNAHYHDGVKSAHLTYIGDTEVGQKTNIGCGTVTANYDGFNKDRTTIGEECFIGSGTIMVAPIKIDDRSFTAAGSTITKDVNSDDMAIARARQETIPHGYTTFRAKAKAKKEAKVHKE